MKHIPFLLDIPPMTPADEFAIFVEEGGWIIAIATLLVIGAVVGIILFTKKHKKSDKETKETYK